MTDSELFDMFAQERINMHLKDMTKNEESKERNAKLSEMEIFIQNIPDKNRELIESCTQDFIDIIANRETHLYKCGLLDGLKVMRKINEL